MNSGKPILFNGEMVRSILSGDKTCTRRVIKPQPKSKLCYTFVGGGCGTWGYPSSSSHEIWGEEYRLPDDITKDDLAKRWIPPYHADDILYVRETWFKDVDRYMYRANYSDREKFYRDGKEIEMKWKPSIHMPKEAARIWLKVKDVRVERLQDITPQQAENEGVGNLFYEDIGYSEKNYGTEVDKEYGIAREQFAWLWNSTIKKSDIDRYGWDANPWVWVIEFERCAELGKE